MGSFVWPIEDSPSGKFWILRRLDGVPGFRGAFSFPSSSESSSTKGPLTRGFGLKDSISWGTVRLAGADESFENEIGDVVEIIVNCELSETKQHIH